MVIYQFPESYFLTILISVIIFGNLEPGLWKLFPLFFYHYGIPIIWRSKSNLRYVNHINIEGLQDMIENKKLIVEIQNLNDFEYSLLPMRTVKIFKTLKPRYNSLTRGHIEILTQDTAIKLRVLLNWYVIPFSFVWLGFASMFLEGFYMLAAFIILAVTSYQTYQNERSQYLEIWDRIINE